MEIYTGETAYDRQQAQEEEDMKKKTDVRELTSALSGNSIMGLLTGGKNEEAEEEIYSEFIQYSSNLSDRVI